MAAVRENECQTTVLVLLTKTDVDGLLGLAECLSTVENALVKGLLRKSSLGALGGVLAVRNGGALEDLHHSLCAVLVVFLEDLLGARGDAAVGDGVVAGHGGLVRVVEGDGIASSLVGGELLRTGVVNVNLSNRLELFLEGIDGHADGGGRVSGSLEGDIVLGEGRGSDVDSGEHSIDGKSCGIHCEMLC